MTEIDGGKICAACPNTCCRGCNQTLGYFLSSHVSEDVNTLQNSGISKEEFYEFYDLLFFNKDRLKDERFEELHQLFSERLGTFDLKTGFLGPKGCTIPREKRSRVCLTYACSKLREARQTQNL